MRWWQGIKKKCRALFASEFSCQESLSSRWPFQKHEIWCLSHRSIRTITTALSGAQ